MFYQAVERLRKATVVKRTKSDSSSSQERPILVRPQSEAKSKLQDRVSKGSDLLERCDSSNYEEINKEYKKWTAYNVKLLKEIFSNDSCAKEYNGFGHVVVLSGHTPTLFEKTNALKSLISDRISKIESFVERLELFKEVDTPLQTPVTRKTGKEMNFLKIFVSHSSENEELASSLVQLLRLAFHLEPKEIRCTSVDGYRLQAGANINETIRQEIQNSSVFIALLTPECFNSFYVMFEVGARWGSQKKLFPLLAEGATFEHAKAPLNSLNILETKEASIQQMLEETAAELNVPPPSLVSLGSSISSFINLSKKKTAKP